METRFFVVVEVTRPWGGRSRYLDRYNTRGMPLLRDPAGINSAAKLERLAHRADHAVRAIEREVAAKTIDRLDARAVCTDEIIEAKPTQLLRRPRERFLFGVEEMDAPDQRVHARRSHESARMLDDVDHARMSATGDDHQPRFRVDDQRHVVRQ